MEVFEAQLKLDDGGRLTIIDIPFNAKEVFHQLKGTIYVHGTINEIAYRSKLLSRGKGRFAMVVDKALQKAVGFQGRIMAVHITMESDSAVSTQTGDQEPPAVACNMDVITAIQTRKSIRKFTLEPLSKDMLNTILSAGLSAPTAKNKRPYHFLVITERQILFELAHSNSNAAMLESAPCAIVVCGDKNIEGIKEFLYADCAAATQNMLLCIHGLGIGGVWCGIKANTDWQKLIITKCALPPKMEPVTVIAVGWPDETRELCQSWEPEKIHLNQW